MKSQTPNLVEVEQSACLRCASLGAMIAFSGVGGCARIVHGGPGCAAQIRRTLARHFRAPVEIRTSAVSDAAAILGGESQLAETLADAVGDERPELAAVCTSCLTETIGDDVGGILDRVADSLGCDSVWVSAPSYRDSLLQGYHNASSALVDRFASPEAGAERSGVNVFPGLFSPADLRFLKRALDAFRLDYTMLPDYSDSLDPPVRPDRRGVSATEVSRIRRLGSRTASIEFVTAAAAQARAGRLVESRCALPAHRIVAPIGVEGSDCFYRLLSSLSGAAIGDEIRDARGRLIAGLVDAAAILAGKRVGLVGESDLIPGVAALLSEAGAVPVAAAGDSACELERLDLMLGHSDALAIASRLNVPLLRAWFPIHDRRGGARRRTLGYEGSLRLLDEIVNALLDCGRS